MLLPMVVSLLTWNQFFRMYGSMPATTAPTPMKKLCMANPLPRCCSGNLSATKARKGSMLTLMLASRIQSSPAAIQRVLQLGMTMRAMELRMAPTRKYGRRRPSGPQVRSLSAPMMGCMMKPVSGAASQSMGICESSAPRYL